MASCCVYVHMYAHLYMCMWWPSGNAEISISLGLLSEKCYCCFCECIGVAHGQIQVIFNCASENIFFFFGHCSETGKECPANGWSYESEWCRNALLLMLLLLSENLRVSVHLYFRDFNFPLLQGFIFLWFPVLSLQVEIIIYFFT